MIKDNPPLTRSTLRIATYGVPGDVLDRYVADRIRYMSEVILRARRKVSYRSVNDWADELEKAWTTPIALNNWLNEKGE